MGTHTVRTEYERQKGGDGRIRRVEPEFFDVVVSDEAVDHEFQRLCQKFPDKNPTKEHAADSLAQTKLALAETLGLLDGDREAGDPMPRGTSCSGCGRRHVMCKRAHFLIGTGQSAYCDDCKQAMFKKCSSCGKDFEKSESEFCWTCQDEDMRPFRISKVGAEKDPMQILLSKIIRSGERENKGISLFALPLDHPDFAKADGSVAVADLLPRLDEAKRVKRSL